MADMLEPLAAQYIEPLAHGLQVGRQQVTLAAGLGVLPLCLLRSLHALRFTSVLCVVAVSALAGCIAYKSLTEGYAFAPPPLAGQPSHFDTHHRAADLQAA